MLRFGNLGSFATFVCIVASSGALGQPPAPPAPSPLLAVPVAAAAPVRARDVAVVPLSVYTPPACTGVFADVPCPGGFAVNWVEQLYNDGITSGCGGGDYCPSSPVTRAQMAVFLEKAMRGTGNWPAHVAFAWAVKNPDGTPSPAASGTALLAAVASIPTTGNDAPGYGNPWLLKIGPGVFDLGSSALTVPDYVSVEGAGRSATTIQSTGSSGPGAATVVTGGLEELSELTINNTGNAAYATGLLVAGASSSVRRVAVTVTPGSTTSRGVYLTGSAGPTMEDVDISLFNAGAGDFYGIYSDPGSSPTLDLVGITLGANGTGGGNAVQLTGGLTGRRINAQALFYGGTTATVGGIVVSGAVDLRDSSVVAGCAGNAAPAYGVYGTSGVTLTNVHVDDWRKGGGTCTCFAAFLYDASGTVSGSTLRSYNYGIFTTGATAPRSVSVDNSVLDGYGGGYIGNGSNYTTVIGAGRISAGWGHANSGTLTCASVYGDDGTAYPSSCP